MCQSQYSGLHTKFCLPENQEEALKLAQAADQQKNHIRLTDHKQAQFKPDKKEKMLFPGNQNQATVAAEC